MSSKPPERQFVISRLVMSHLRRCPASPKDRTIMILPAAVTSIRLGIPHLNGGLELSSQEQWSNRALRKTSEVMTCLKGLVSTCSFHHELIGFS